MNELKGLAMATETMEDIFRIYHFSQKKESKQDFFATTVRPMKLWQMMTTVK